MVRPVRLKRSPCYLISELDFVRQVTYCINWSGKHKVHGISLAQFLGYMYGP